MRLFLGLVRGVLFTMFIAALFSVALDVEFPKCFVIIYLTLWLSYILRYMADR